MNRPNKYADIGFLSILGILACLTYYVHYIDGIALTINNVLAFIFLGIAIQLKLRKASRYQFFLFFILLLSSFDILAFIPQISVANKEEFIGFAGFVTPDIDPICIFLLMLYWLINFNTIRDTFWSLFNKKVERDTMTEFYRDKFFNATIEELDDAFANYEKYPEEAQLALKEIHQVRKLNLRSFA